MANIYGNYLQVVTKDTLENQVGLGICMARFASHCGRIIGAHPKQSVFQLTLQLGAKCLVISELTISILGILRRHYIPLATDPHTTTGVNSRSNDNNRHTRGESLHCALLLDYVPPEEPPSTPLGNALRIR